MNPYTARKLLALLKAIDADHPKDFVDLVCAARDALPAGTEAELAFLERGDTRDAEIGQATNRACGELPEGWELRIELENGAGTVRLYDPAGDEVDEEFHDHDSFGASITEAIDYAIGAVKIK